MKPPVNYHWRRFKKDGKFHWSRFLEYHGWTPAYSTQCGKVKETKHNWVTYEPEDWACPVCCRLKAKAA